MGVDRSYSIDYIFAVFVVKPLPVVVLLAGGSKRTQQRDIKRAQALAALLD